MGVRKAETFPPVTMGHIRGHGCRELLVYCGSGRCHHSAAINVDWLPDDMSVRSLCRRMVCTQCGMIGADVTPFVFFEEVEFSFEDWTWPFAEQRRGEIEAYFRQQQANNPALWNGRLLLLHAPAIRNTVLTERFFQTDYASMLAALEWQAMEDDVRACFPVAALLTSDEAFIVGEMAQSCHNRTHAVQQTAGRVFV
jgi:hypothetical protein